MLADLIELTHLPNLHPAVVHFPLALWPVAVLAELAGLAARRQEWLGKMATALYLLAAAGALAAYWSGHAAADGATGLTPDVLAAVGAHSDAAVLTVWLLGALAVARLAFALGGWSPTVDVAARALMTIGAVSAFVVLLRTADLGGGLVFVHGVAVQGAAVAGEDREASPTEPVRAVATRLETDEDGSIAWSPAAADGGELGAEVVVLSEGEAPITTLEGGPGSTGLPLAVDGEALLLLPGQRDDVHVEIRLALEGFRGRVGAVHHAQGVDEVDLFVVSTDGQVAIVRRLDGHDTQIDTGSIELPAERFTLAVNASGRHLKGLLDGSTVTHGHIASMSPGRCGLYVNGEGRLRIDEVRVTPLGDD